KKHAGVAILGGTLACLICVDARADDQFQGTFQASLGYTDNVYSSPSEPVPDIEEKTGDFLGLFSPGVVYASASDGQSHRATYAVTGSLFFKEFSASRFSNRLEYKGFFDL